MAGIRRVLKKILDWKEKRVLLSRLITLSYRTGFIVAFFSRHYRQLYLLYRPDVIVVFRLFKRKNTPLVFCERQQYATH